MMLWDKLLTWPAYRMIRQGPVCMFFTLPNPSVGLSYKLFGNDLLNPPTRDKTHTGALTLKQFSHSWLPLNKGLSLCSGGSLVVGALC